MSKAEDKQIVQLLVPTKDMDDASSHMIATKFIPPRVKNAKGIKLPILGACFGADNPKTVHLLFSELTSRFNETLWRVSVPAERVYEDCWEVPWAAHRVRSSALKYLLFSDPMDQITFNNKLVLRIRDALVSESYRKKRQAARERLSKKARGLMFQRRLTIELPKSTVMRGIRVHDLLLLYQAKWNNAVSSEMDSGTPRIHAAFSSYTGDDTKKQHTLAVYGLLDDFLEPSTSKFCMYEMTSAQPQLRTGKQWLKGEAVEICGFETRVRRVMNRSANRALKATMKLPTGAKSNE